MGTPPAAIVAGSSIQGTGGCTPSADAGNFVPVSPVSLSHPGPFQLVGAGAGSPLAVPAADRFGLGILALALAAMAVWWLARMRGR